MIKVHLCRSNNLGGYAIQAALFSRWNHVAIEVGGSVFDATLACGVASWAPEGFTDRYDEVETIEIELPDEAAGLAFLMAQVGKRYDWAPLIALPIRADWQDPDRWFCSELFAAFLEAGGIIVLSELLPGYRVTPRDARIVAHVIRTTQIEARRHTSLPGLL